MTRMPQVTARDLIRFLKAQGFVEDRQSGSHLTLWHEGRGVSLTISIHPECSLQTHCFWYILQPYLSYITGGAL